jgi:hypothetical protein
VPKGRRDVGGQAQTAHFRKTNRQVADWKADRGTWKVKMGAVPNVTGRGRYRERRNDLTYFYSTSSPLPPRTGALRPLETPIEDPYAKSYTVCASIDQVETTSWTNGWPLAYGCATLKAVFSSARAVGALCAATTPFLPARILK